MHRSALAGVFVLPGQLIAEPGGGSELAVVVLNQSILDAQVGDTADICEQKGAEGQLVIDADLRHLKIGSDEDVFVLDDGAGAGGGRSGCSWLLN